MEGMRREGRERERLEVIALYSGSEDIHQVGGWCDTEEQALQNIDRRKGLEEL